VTRGTIRRLSDEDPVDGRSGLKPRRGVDDITRGHALPEIWPGAQRHERLARVDGDPHLELERWIGFVELNDRLANRDRGTNGPLGIVLVRHGRAEERDDGVADELLHRAAVPLELMA